MAKEKLMGNWKKEGSSRIGFFKTYIPNQDKIGFIKEINQIKAKKRGWSDSLEGVFQWMNGDTEKIQGSIESPFGKWMKKKKEGDKVRVLYHGGALEGGIEMPKSGFKDFEAFKKWKKKNRFYPDYEFFGV